MGLSRLDNFLKSTRGTIIYVDPNALDATDSIENQGNSLSRPFRTIQRALMEAARFSYQRGLDNDRFAKTTILLYPGLHVVDNRPGLIPDGTNNYRMRSGGITSDFGEFSLTTDVDLTSPNNNLYKLNSIHGGIIVPRGTSIVGMDLRKTKVRPLYVPNPENDNIERSAIFRVTGACYFWQFSMFDGDPNGTVYKDYTTNKFVPNFSHHKLACFEYADGVNTTKIDDDFQTFETARTDLDMYYEKVGIAFGPSSGRPIDPDYPADEDIEPVIDEFRIVGSRGGSVGISSIKSGDGATGNTTITVTTTDSFPNLSVDSPIRIAGLQAQGYNGQFVVSSVVSDTEFTYQVQNTPVELLPSVTGSSVNLAVDTVTSASPYIFNCSLRSVFGMCGMLADGSKASGFKSMVVAQFTGIGLQKDDKAFVKYDSTTGTYKDSTGFSNLHSDSLAKFKPEYENFHIRGINDAYMQLVSVFAIGYAQHFSVESGGDFSINNSNSNFGAKAFQCSGFRNSAFSQDDTGYISHILSPKEVDTTVNNINYLPLDTSATVSVGSTDKLYIADATDQNNPPATVVDGYRIGAKTNDQLYLAVANSGVSTTYSARIIMPNTQYTHEETTSEKVRYVERVNDVNNINSNVINLSAGHLLTNGEKIRIVSDNGELPDGLENNSVYFAITNEKSVGLTTSQIKIAQTLNDAVNDSPITINAKGGILKVISRVSDKKVGEIGHPVGFDTSQGQWYVNVATASSENSIFEVLNNIPNGKTARTYFTRTPDTRGPLETVYRYRYVIPKDSTTFARPPLDGYVLQESNNVIGAGNTEIQKYFAPGGATLTNSTELRNPRFVKSAEWAGNVAKINTELPHDLTVGAQVEVLNVSSANNAAGVASTAFNGTFTVTGISSTKQFSYTLSQDPGTFTGVTTTRNSNLPHFRKKKYNNTFSVFKAEELQKYVQNVQDGVYHLTVVNTSITPGIAPFNTLKLSQPLDNLYPQTNRDNPASDPVPATSYADQEIIGNVYSNEPQNSVTKEAAEKAQIDFASGIGLVDIKSTSGIAHTLYTSHDHGLCGITSVTVTNAGAGYTTGTYYGVRLGVSTTGANANARVTVDGTGAISDVTIMDGGSAYEVGDIISLVDVGTTAPSTPAVLRVQNTYNCIGECIEVGGVTRNESQAYDEYNTLYKITSVGIDNITVQSSDTIASFTTAGVGVTMTAKARATNTGRTAGISTFHYQANTGIATVTFSGAHGFRLDSKLKTSGFDSSLYNGEFLVTKVNSPTQVEIKPGITTTAPATGGNVTIYRPSLSSNGGDISESNEAISGRLVAQYAGISTTLGAAINSTDSDLTPIVVDNAELNGLRLGDYLQIDDEIFRIKETVSGDSLTIFRGLLGTRRQDHSLGTQVKKVKPLPVELRRNSIIRASAHTFEYLGFGPGNYSTAFPERQNRILSEKEILNAQALRLEGGVTNYSGMDDRGNFYTANRKLSTVSGDEESYNTPIQTVTGEDPGPSDTKVGTNGINISDANVSEFINVEGGPANDIISTFDGPVVFNQKIASKSDEGIETKNLYIQGEADVARKRTIGVGSTPTEAGTPGDLVFKASPKLVNDYAGWIYTVNNAWEPYGFIGTLPTGLTFGSANQITYKDPGNNFVSNPNLRFQDNSTLIVGAATSSGSENHTLQVTGSGSFSGGVGIGTTYADSPLHVIGGSELVGVVTISTQQFESNTVLNGPDIVVNAFKLSGSSGGGIVTATAGVVTYFGDGSKLTGITFPTAGAWHKVTGGSDLFTLTSVGIGTSVMGARLNVGVNDGGTIDAGIARFFAPSMADSTHNGIAVGKDFNSFRCVTQTYHWAGGNQNSGSYYDISHKGHGAQLVIADNNRIGIGTTAPSHKLEVEGNVSVASSVTAESFHGSGTIPVGGIIMWSGATIPTGWQLCDGTNNAPDLRDRFVVGSGSSYNINDTGGEAGVTLTTNQIPGHDHNVQVSSTSTSSASVTDPGHSHSQTGGGSDDDGGANVPGSNSSGTQNNISSATTGISVDVTTTTTSTVTQNAAGGGQSHENRPPYYALAFIMRMV